MNRKAVVDMSMPANQTARVTLKDIAARTGVAVSTVSRVLNVKERPWADEALSRKILETARVLGYRANTHARALAGGKTRTVYLITRHSPFTMDAVKVIKFQYELDKLGRNVVLRDPGLHPDPGRVVDLLLADAPEAVVFMLNAGLKPLTSICKTLNNNGMRILFMDYDQRPPIAGRMPADIVAVDRAYGAELAVTHLIEQGHEKIGLLAARHMIGRQEGYERALKAHGIAFRAIARIDAAAEAGEQGITGFMKKHPAVTAVFCGSDNLAAGAMRGILRGGRRIPDDMAMVGFDGEPWTPYLPVPLTTVVQPVAELCRVAAGMLRRRLQSQKQDAPALRWETVAVKPELLVRASSITHRP